MSKRERNQKVLFIVFLILLLLTIGVFRVIKGWTIDKVPTGIGLQFNINKNNEEFQEEFEQFLKVRLNLELQEKVEDYLTFESENTSVTVANYHRFNYKLFITTKNETSKEWEYVAQKLRDYLVLSGVHLSQITLQRNPSVYDCGDINKLCDQDVTDCVSKLDITQSNSTESNSISNCLKR